MIKNILRSHKEFNERQELFNYKFEANYLLLFINSPEFQKCKRGTANDLLQLQYINLKILAEEGIAEEFKNGFMISFEDAIKLDTEYIELFNLPKRWPGSFAIYAKGITYKNNFSVRIDLFDNKGDKVTYYKRDNILLRISDESYFLLDQNEFEMFESYEIHKNSQKQEYDNLYFISKLKYLKDNGLEIDLSHFNDFEFIMPDKIKVGASLDDDGNLELIPIFDQDININEIEKRLGQLNPLNNNISLKINKKIIILDEDKLKAAYEIIKFRNENKISKSSIKNFINNPSAYIDASLVDLDIGFSLRVKGATEFRLAYFGDTDKASLDWFESKFYNNDIINYENLSAIVRDFNDILEIEEKFNDSLEVGAKSFKYKDRLIVFEDINKFKDSLDLIKVNLKHLDNGQLTQNKTLPSKDDNNSTKHVLDILDNDENLEFKIDSDISINFFKGELESNYLRELFLYQEEGVRWMMGNFPKNLDKNKDDTDGILLADDMGLGKTFMTLVTINEFIVKEKINKPILVVAPLSLIENWENEINLTYKTLPFTSIIKLQSNLDLKKFKLKNAKNELKQELGNIQYALKIGQKYSIERLDLPGRIVITTYQTLRDYQFSLCSIDWGIVCFDEAQNIKNPNALQTRAAKGLKANFKIAITGTPVENELRDFWCIFDTIKPGFLDSYQNFRKKYIVPIIKSDISSENEIRKNIGIQLRKKVDNFMIRRTKEEKLDGLTNKHIKEVKIEMKDQHLNTYNMLINFIQSQKELTPNKGSYVLEGLHKLKYVSLHPYLITQNDLSMIPSNNLKEVFLSSNKMEILLEILNDIKNKNEKVIIFLINKKIQVFLKLFLSKEFNLEIDIINGDTKAVSKNKNLLTRKKMIDNFESSKNFNIIIMSPVAAGTGLTIVGANHVIHFERHWNPAKESQATDRVYRIGQKKDVFVYLPILEHPNIESFDVKLSRLLNNKIDIKDAIITPTDIIKDLGRDKQLFENTITFEDEVISENELENIGWEAFEALVAEIMSRTFDSKVYLTAISNDKGADVIVLDELDKMNILIQCKQTAQGLLKNEYSVIEVFNSKKYYENKLSKRFDKLYVYTNAKSISNKVIETSKIHKVDIFKFNDITKLLRKYKITRLDILKRIDCDRIS